MDADELLNRLAMLEFLLSHFQSHSPHMDGTFGYRFMNGHWPWSNARGRTIEEAVKAAMIERDKEQV
jgi:hypothetical protein